MAYLIVRLTRNPGEAEFALADLLGMVRAIASREGIALQPVSSTPELAVFVMEAASLSQFSSELGRHRIQYVPKSWSTGRVRTAEVMFSVQDTPQESAEDSTAWPVVKTYNYPLKRVIRHATGKVGTLEQGLAGEV